MSNDKIRAAAATAWVCKADGVYRTTVADLPLWLVREPDGAWLAFCVRPIYHLGGRDRTPRGALRSLVYRARGEGVDSQFCAALAEVSPPEATS